jgi:hypothetical protein
MNNFKRISSTLCATSILIVFGFLVRSSRSAPSADAVTTDDCVGCTQSKIQIELTGDPDGDAAAWAKANAAAEVMHAAIIAKNGATRLAALENWRGTTLAAKDSINDQDTIALHVAASKAFSADPPAPAGRTAVFQQWLAADSEIRCVGYYGTVESVTPNADGKLVVINVSPRLLSKKSGVLFTPGACVEAWQMADDGSLTNLKSIVHPKRSNFVIFND